MTEFTSYCLGFAFDIPQPKPNMWPQRGRVALIRKIKPEWQAGHLNGIGGMIEDFDRDHGASCAGLEAMVREFREETGFSTQVEVWQSFHIMGNDSWQVECFKAFNIPLEQLKSTTDEKVVITYVDQLPGSVLFNLRWLIPLSLDPQPLPTMQVYR
ncbi:hypothetical protein LCGC14_0244340 [marine sediment metagenome]|uniref:Nudix hydrolase domain-containing protein n=1 Tax=marine sediment metagenome TaxID=412755 RepID=A0A0F9UMW6_9ZZZZ